MTVLLSSGELPATSLADGIPTVRIAPSSKDVVVNDTVTTDVLIEDVTDLYGYEFQIAFDPALVEVVDACPDPLYCPSGVQIQPGNFLSPDWIIQNTVDNGSGTIAFALSQQDPSPPQSGTGVLATITWRGKAVGTSPVEMTYTLLSGLAGAAIASDSQDGQITVRAVDLELSKAMDDATPGLGEQVVFTLTLKNTGDIDATGVEVTDYWPSQEVQYDSHSGGTYDPVTGIWDVGTLAAGGSTTLQITGTVLKEVGFVNAAEVSGCNEPDTDSTPGNFPSNPIEDDEAEVGGSAAPTALIFSSFEAGPSAGIPTLVLRLALMGLVAVGASYPLWTRR